MARHTHADDTRTVECKNCGDDVELRNVTTGTRGGMFKGRHYTRSIDMYCGVECKVESDPRF